MTRDIEREHLGERSQSEVHEQSHDRPEKNVFSKRKRRKAGEFGPVLKELKTTAEAIRLAVAATGLTGEKAEDRFSELLLETLINENR